MIGKISIEYMNLGESQFITIGGIPMIVREMI